MSDTEPASPAIITRPTRETATVVLCRKCRRKLHGGYGPGRRQDLRDLLKDALKQAGLRRQTRIMESKCLGICPKHATTMLVSTQPGRAFVVPCGAREQDITALVRGGD